MRHQFGKRLFDFVIALALLAFLWPLMLLTIVFIKHRSPGPAFFSQERVGQYGRPFRIWKFRTMVVREYSRDDSSVSVRNDPRVFSGGHLLRKLKIDELPQLWNVVNGTMSLVGPRPTVADDYARMSPSQRRRWLVRPGITGLAQIRGGTAVSWPVRIEWDLQYIQLQSFAMDLRILAVTAARVLTARADTHPPGNDEWAAAA